MKINERFVIAFSIIFPLYIYLMFLIITTFIANIELLISKETGFFSASTYERQNSTYYYLIGRYFHYNPLNPDIRKSILYYKKSIDLCPLQSGCWLDIARAYQNLNDISSAGYALERAMKLMPNNPTIKWEVGIFYLMNGEIEKSYKAFKEYILLRPERQEEVYDLVWKLPYDSEKIRNNLIPFSYPYYKRYILYLIESDRLNEARSMWEYMKEFQIEDSLYIKYIDFLLNKHQYDDAFNIWKDYIKKRFGVEEDSDLSLWNGSFEYDIQNGAFDWKVREVEGVDVYIDRDVKIHGNQSLGITFDGKHNPDITIISQIVRVHPGKKYTIKSYIKTDSLTTTNGIFLALIGHDCNFYKESEVITGTNFWRELSIDFDVPNLCNALIVNLRRAKSSKLDNKIGGNVWIDSITLIPR